MAKAAKKAAKKAAPKKAAPKKAVKKAAPKKAAPKKAAPKKAASKAASKATAKSATKPAVKKAAPKKAAPKKAAKKSARKPSAAFMAPLSVSPEMAAVVGNKPMPRTEIIKKIWDYIRKNKLQDSSNKRMINADPKLKEVFGGKDQVSMFDLAKIVNQHVQK